jgi:hypothetical protein
VSVTPAMGASTVAGAISTVAILNEAGTAADKNVRATPAELSHCLRIKPILASIVKAKPLSEQGL